MLPQEKTICYLFLSFFLKKIKIGKLELWWQKCVTEIMMTEMCVSLWEENKFQNTELHNL
jgi:hypothetical protein